MAKIERITLHPLKEDGTIDLNVNLYPKTLLDGIVDRSGTEVEIATQQELDIRLAEKVDKEYGKGLSTNDFTDELKSALIDNNEKLATIETGAEVNVKADWTATEGDAEILHKPTTIAGFGITDAYTKTQIDADIKVKIPAEASSQNQLADKAYVDSAVSVSEARFISPIHEKFEDLPLVGINNNDYTFVVTRDVNEFQADGIHKQVIKYTKYIWDDNIQTANKWRAEYELYNNWFTPNQWSAINSGIESSDIAKIDAAYSAIHSHDNKSILDGISAADITNWNTKISANDATITLKKNNAPDSMSWDFSLNQSSDENIVLGIPETAADIRALPDTTKYGRTFDLGLVQTDPTNTTIKFTLKDQDNSILHTGSVQLNEINLNRDRIQGLEDAIAVMDLAEVGAAGSYIKLISQEDGQLSATSQVFDTDTGFTNADNTNAPTSLAVKTYINAHKNNTGNPHGVTKAQVGLGNVVNTADSAIPVENGTTKFTTGGAYTLQQNLKNEISDTVNNLNVSDITANLGKGKTLTALSETNGKISATAEAIEITSSQISDKQDAYNGTDGKVVTGKAIKAALETLNITDITNSAGKTIKKITETDGKVGAEFQDISITESQISDFGSYAPTSRTIAGLALTNNITDSSLRTALNVADGAQVNVIESITLNGTTFTPTNKQIDIQDVVMCGGSLGSGEIVLGSGSTNCGTNNYKIGDSSITWAASSDVYVPTMKSVSSQLSTKLANYTKKTTGTISLDSTGTFRLPAAILAAKTVSIGLGRQTSHQEELVQFGEIVLSEVRSAAYIAGPQGIEGDRIFLQLNSTDYSGQLFTGINTPYTDGGYIIYIINS